MQDDDRLAVYMLDYMTNPTYEHNKLKRKAKRKCYICGATFSSQLSMLCDGALTCSAVCQAEYVKESR